MTILANIISGAALAALLVVFYALGVTAGREPRSSGKKISAWNIHFGEKEPVVAWMPLPNPPEVNADD